MPKSTKGKFIKSVTIIDPDTKGEVEIEFYKLDGGGIIGIDASFIETGEVIYSPFDKNLEVDIDN